MLENDRCSRILERIHKILSKNVYARKDDTYYNLKCTINDRPFAVVSGDKDLHVVTIERDIYINKL